MRFDVITLFPELFSAHLVHGVTRRAFEPGRSTCASGRCALSAIRRMRASTTGPTAAARGWCCSPSRSSASWRRSGRRARKTCPRRWSASARPARCSARPRSANSRTGAERSCSAPATKGVDQRFIDAHVDLELSIGDYRAVGWRTAGAGPARRARPAAARRARRRALAPAGQLLRGSARLPALQPARAARRRFRSARGSAVGQPRGDRRMAPRAVARP